MYKSGFFSRKRDYFSDFMPWGFSIHDGVILNKDGSFIKTLRYQGPDLGSSSNVDALSLSYQLNLILKDIKPGYAFFFDAIRVPMLAYPESRFDNCASLIISEEQKERVRTYGNYYETKYYLTIQYLPPIKNMNKAVDYFFDGGQGEGVATAELHNFLSDTSLIFEKLSRITEQTGWLNTEELLRFLHGKISNKDHPISEQNGQYLDVTLPDTTFIGGLTPKLGNDYLAAITLAGLPNYTSPRVLEFLNNMPFEYSWTTRFLFLSEQEANAYISEKRRHWYSSRKSARELSGELITGQDSPLQNEASVDHAMDLSSAMSGLQKGDVGYGVLTSTIIIKHKDQEELGNLSEIVEESFNSSGCATVNETFNCVEAFFGTLPGCINANIRRLVVNTRNLSDISPISSEWAGIPWNDHLSGPPLFIGRITGGSAFQCCLHDGDVGHTMIVGPTGAGKSVLLSYIALQFKKYKNSQVFFIDKGKSAKAAFLAMGGESLDFSLEGTVTIQPLRDLENENDLGWAQEWIEGVLERESVECSHEVKQELRGALVALKSNERDDRTLQIFSDLVQLDSIKSGLGQYLEGGTFSKIFDSEKNLNLESNTIHLEVGELLKYKKASIAVLEYLFHALEKKFHSGKPTILVLDEAWLLFDNEGFSKKLKEWLKTLRKLNVSVIFATQSLNDLVSSSISTSLIESCPTRIYLPNLRADEPHIAAQYKSFGLTDTQISILKNAVPKQDYYYHSRLGKMLFTLDLGPIALSVCGASSVEDIQFIESIEGQEDFLEKFLLSKEFSWASHTLKVLDENKEKWMEK